MARSCPNRTRRSRLGLGGGAVSCQGRLEVVLVCAVSIPLKSMGTAARRAWPLFEDAVSAYVRRHGVRLTPLTLAGAYHAAGAGAHRADIRCDSCGWSLRRLLDSVNRAAHRRKR